MGVVYRAEDRERGKPVAFKVLHDDQRPDRFLREAAMLADLSHPAVVRYVAHGVTDRGELYLAMEWLDSSSLSSVLATRRLGLGECVLVLRRICEGLAVAHELGMVHRDLKPGNILLPDGELTHAKLIDFGIARRRFDPRITERGLLLGTLAYMSPEQARGAQLIETSSDVFSLGSLVYKCMTGDTPFGGGASTAVLAKILLDEPEPLSELAAGIPAAFDELVARMLAKAPEHRPRDARAVLNALVEIGADAPAAGAPAGITSRERRMVWTALLGGGASPEDTDTVAVAPLQTESGAERRLDELVNSSGGRADTLADGTRVASFVSGGTPKDDAEKAVRIAARMRDLFPERPVALGSGLGLVGGRAPVGEAIDACVRLIALTGPGCVTLDDATAELVGDSYEIARDPRGHAMLGARRDADGTRKLLGRATTCVGRDRELSTLDALFQECVEEPVARVALVVAPAGVGKSRLRYEIVRRARELRPDVEVLVGRAESVSAGSPFGLLRSALGQTLGVRDTESLTSNQARLEERVRRHARAATDVRQTAVFLGELTEIPFPVDAHDRLLAARQNPTLLGDAMRGAWLDFLADECRAHPVLLVLEDLHWGDLPTVNFVDAALAELHDLPLFVLALARPEVHDLMPKLWERREPIELRLGPLRKSASLALAREVLGESAEAAVVERAVELADGNAFFLEELIRAVADGREHLPATVLDMLQARLEALGPEPRRLLRAAAVFGEQFRHGGVIAVLGQSADEALVSSTLEDLTARELISKRREGGALSEIEYVFRHATLRDAVYATLTPDDRALGHRLAADWLSASGSGDALGLAEHYRQGLCPGPAARFYLSAAEQALEGADLAAVLARVQRALELNPDDSTRGELHYLAADAHFWRGEYLDAEHHARAAVDLLPAGSARWYVAIGALCSAAGTLGKDQELIAWAGRAMARAPIDEEARANQIVAMIRASHGHLKLGLHAAADELITRADELSADLSKLTLLGRAWVHHGRSARAYYDGDVGKFVAEVELALLDFDAIGDWRTGGNARANLGYAALSIGDFDRAERLLEEALGHTERLGLAGIGHYVLHNLGLVRAHRGRFEEAIELERRAIHEAETRNETLLIGASHLYMALILLMAGRPAEAELEAQKAQTAAPNVPVLIAQGLAAEATALLARAQPERALEKARAAFALLDERGTTDEAEGRVRCAMAEALAENGRLEEAREGARLAVTRLRERAEKLGDSGLARGFMENVPEHARLVALAEA